MNIKKTLLICLIILVVGTIITVIIYSTEPEAKRGGATKKTAMLVDVVTVERDTFQPVVVATGSVQPSQDITLSPRVRGEIVQRSSQFIPGGNVQKGQMLLSIDPADYENILLQRKSDLRQARADLNIEEGRQHVARQDYDLVGDTLTDNLTDANLSLVLREPQLESAKADVEAAQASVRQAELDLERTTIRAPFDAHILRRNANTGSQVAPGDDLGRLVGVDEYWVVATVPLSKVNWLSFSGQDAGKGSLVQIKDRKSWSEGHYRTGYLDKRVGALEDQTRLARVLITVPDPLAYHNDTLQPLMIGSFVETQIQARPIPDVVRLNRDYLRQGETAWVMKDGKLEIRQLDIIFEDSENAYVRSGLEDGDSVVSTSLSTVVDGAPLRLEADTLSQEAKSNGTEAGGTP